MRDPDTFLAPKARLHRASVVAICTTAAFLCSGCGLLAQTAIGWHSAESKREKKSHTVNVTSIPSGADVVRTNPDGGKTPLGVTPLADTLSYEQEVITESPNATGLLIGGALEVGLGILSIASGSGGGSDSTASFGDSGGGGGFSLSRQAQLADSGTSVGLIVLGGTLVYFGVQDLIIAMIHGLSGDSVKERKSIGNAQYSYTAKTAAFPERTEIVRVPDRALATIVLDESAPEAKAAIQVQKKVEERAAQGGGSLAVSAAAKEWVIAVMDVEDMNANSKGKGLERDLVRNLGDQLRIFIAQYGVRTIDRGAQEKALKDQIDQIKSDSYSSCYDDSCQIELGKALAASHILRSRVTRFGSRCVLNAELIDLRAEVTVKAASSKGDCEDEGFLGMSEEVANNLLK